MITFIEGGAGSGKSETIYKRIEDDIKNRNKVIFLVPRQQGYITERNMTKRLGEHDFTLFKVETFSTLSRSVFSKYGGLCRNYIDKAGQAIIMWRALNDLKTTLKYFSKANLNDISFIDELLQLVEDFTTSNISPESFASYTEKINDNLLLKSKCEDLSLVYTRYKALLHESYDDNGEDLSRLHKLLKNNNYFEGINVYIDAFYSFTPVELDIISDIFKGAKNTTISLMSNSELFEYDRVEITKKRLQRIAGDEIHEEVLTAKPRYKDEVLPDISDILFKLENFDYHHSSENIPVEIIECKNFYNECEWIAADIRRRVREENLRWKDIAVITRNLPALRGVIDEAFDAQEIPYHLSIRCDVEKYPLIRFLMLSLRILANGWRGTDIIAYLKTGILNLTIEETDEFVDYIQTWRIDTKKRWENEWHMNPAGFKDVRPSDFDEKITRLNNYRLMVFDPLDRLADNLAQEINPQNAAKYLYEFLCETALTKKSYTKEESDVWNCICKSLDSLYDCGGTDTISIEALSSLLKTTFNHSDFGTIPSTNDEINIADAVTARVENPKYVYLCQANEGVFPALTSQNTFFSDDDILALEKLELKIFDTSLLKANDESFFFYRSFAFASEKVIITYSNFNLKGDTVLIPSLPVLNIDKIVKNDIKNEKETIIRKYTDFDPDFYIESSNYAKRHMVKFDDNLYTVAISELFEEKLPEYTSIYNNSIILPDRFIQTIYPEEIKLSKSKIDDFNDCPLKYYCNDVLYLSSSYPEYMNAADMGTYVHYILQHYFSEISEDKTLFERYNKEEKVNQELLDKWSDQYIKDNIGSIDYMPYRTQSYIDRLKSNTYNSILNLHQEFNHSKFRPYKFEYPIRKDAELLPIEYTVNNKNVYLNGIIDRLDTALIGNKLYYRIVDYKTGNIKEFSGKPETVSKNNLQLLLYLFTITNENNQNKINKNKEELIPAGVEYLKINSKIGNISHRIGNIDNNEELKKELTKYKYSRVGFSIDNPVIKDLYCDNDSGLWLPTKEESETAENLVKDATLDKYKSNIKSGITDLAEDLLNGNASAKSNNHCKYCPYQTICRMEVKR